MKNFVIATALALATLASIGSASASYDLYTNGYSTTLQSAFSGGDN